MCQPDGSYGPITDREVAVRGPRTYQPGLGGRQPARRAIRCVQRPARQSLGYQCTCCCAALTVGPSREYVGVLAPSSQPCWPRACSEPAVRVAASVPVARPCWSARGAALACCQAGRRAVRCGGALTL